MAKKVIKITEADIRRIVAKVIEEQIGGTAERYGNQAANTTGNYGAIDQLVDKANYLPDALKQIGGIKQPIGRIARDKQRLQNIANMKKQAAANKGMVTVGGKPMRWTDYIAQYNIQPDEIAAAEKLNVTADTNLKNQQARYQNIINVQNTVDANGIIQNPKSKLNGTSWSQYLKDFKITPDELAKANAYAKGGAGKTQQQTQQKTQQQKQVVTRQKDPKVLELQKSLGFTGQDLDGVMGPKTRAAMAAKQKGGTTPPPTFTGQSQIPNLGGKTLQSLFPKASQYTGPSAEQRMNDILSVQNKKYNFNTPSGAVTPPIEGTGESPVVPK